MLDRRTYAQAVSDQAVPGFRFVTEVDAITIPVPTVDDPAVNSPRNLDTQTDWVEDTTSYEFHDALKHQVLSQECKLEAPIVVKSENVLLANAWKSGTLKWSKRARKLFRGEVNTTAYEYVTPSKQETECIVHCISMELSASNMLIIAPSHPFTGKGEKEVKTKPHITVEVTVSNLPKYTLHVHHDTVHRDRPHHVKITWVTRAIRGTQDSHQYLVYKENM